MWKINTTILIILIWTIWFFSFKFIMCKFYFGGYIKLYGNKYTIYVFLFTIKKECFAIGLPTQFLNYNDHFQLYLFLHYKWYRTSHLSCKNCNSSYIWCNSMQLITIPLQLCQNNSFSTIMQVHYNYCHNIILTLLIFIHSLKFDMWHYGDFWM
jgi:hypothetical protein